MKSVMAVLISLLAATSWAQTTEIYDLYDSGEKQPHFVTIHRDGPVVTRIQISLLNKEKIIVLFDIDQKSLTENFQVSSSEASLTVDGLNPIPSSFQGTYNNYWGDAPIGKDSEFTLEFNLTDGCLAEIEDEYELCYLEIGNNTFEEMAMWGYLIKRN
jgi:hypothetical protein